MSQSSGHEEISVWRKEKDRYLKPDPDSPSLTTKESFRGSNSFLPDGRYRLEAKLHRQENRGIVTRMTSKGTGQKFQRYGFFDFDLNGEAVRLQACTTVESEDQRLFIASRDLTSGKVGCGASWYLDLGVAPDDNYVLDFNYACIPYCSYSDDYVCPLPPTEDWLRAEIRVGEKRYHD